MFGCIRLRAGQQSASPREDAKNYINCKKLHKLYRCSQFYSEWRAISRAKQSTSAPRLSRRLGGYRERSAGRVSVMGRNPPDALGQQIITGRRMADVTQTDDADHPLALVHHRQPAELQLLHVMHRLGEGIVLPATMDAFGHHIARHRAASIEAVARQPFADDVAVAHHPDQSVVLPNRNAADVMLPHQFREFGDRGVGAYPVDTLMHHVFDFHGGPPLLEFQVHLMQCSTAPVFSTIQPIGCDGTSASRSQRKVSLLRDRTRQTPSLSLPPPEHSTATSRPGFPPNIEGNGPRAFDAKPGLSISGFTKALCQAPAR